MSRRKTMTIGLAVCAVILIAAVALGMGGVFGLGRYTYENADKYTAGETEITAAVRNLDVDWLSGSVTVAYHDGSTVELRETSKKTIGGDMQLRWWVDGDTLRVRYAKDGVRTWHLFGGTQEKALTLTLPQGIALNDVKFHTTSGDVTVPALSAGTVALEQTSGNVRAAVSAEEIRLNATSGDIELTLTGPVKKADIGVTSGRITLTADETETVNINGTSGRVTLDVKKAGTVNIRTTSGDITAKLGAFTSLNVDATSGDLQLGLPEEPGFTAAVRQTSGSFSSSVALANTDGKHVCGDGSAAVNIHLTSGNIRIDPVR